MLTNVFGCGQEAFTHTRQKKKITAWEYIFLLKESLVIYGKWLMESICFCRKVKSASLYSGKVSCLLDCRVNIVKLLFCLPLVWLHIVLLSFDALIQSPQVISFSFDTRLPSWLWPIIFSTHFRSHMTLLYSYMGLWRFLFLSMLFLKFFRGLIGYSYPLCLYYFDIQSLVTILFLNRSCVFFFAFPLW